MIDELATLAYPPDLVVFPAFALSGAELGGLVAHNAFAAEALDVARSFIQKASLPTLIGTVLPRPALAGTRFVCEEEVIFASGGKGNTLGFLDMYTTTEMQEYVESIQIKLHGLTLSVVLDDFIDPSAHYSDSDAIISLIARPYQETNGLLTSSSQIDSLRTDALSNRAWVVVASLCGGEDSFVYEGASLVMAPDGSVVDSAPPFEEYVFTANLTKHDESPDAASTGEAQGARSGARGKKGRPNLPEARKQDRKRILPLLPYEATWRALEAGVRDYVRKNGFTDVVLGISGGIDSAVVATLAADALGAEHVHGVLMPSPYSSEGSVADAEALAAHLGLKTVVFPITSPFQNFLAESEAILGTQGSDTALQNLQARIRTVILMHLSNSYGWLLLNTGNKSEAAMGYSTLYGDTAGALAPLGAVYKTDVYGLANWRNSRTLAIPQAILNKEPSAELYPGQKDTDRLPPYDTLDQILRLHLEENLGVDEILEFFSSYPIETNIDTNLVLEVLHEVSHAEFKRRQEPMAFQFDGVNLNEHRVWPVTNGFEDHSRDIIAPTEIINYLSMMYREVNPGGRSGGLNFLDN
jgi:NAD+ synthase (glutamine-hydrolysing)